MNENSRLGFAFSTQDLASFPDALEQFVKVILLLANFCRTASPNACFKAGRLGKEGSFLHLESLLSRGPERVRDSFSGEALSAARLVSTSNTRLQVPAKLCQRER